MRFPGQRKSKHYFPVSQREPLLAAADAETRYRPTHVVGVDQTLVDVEARVDDELLDRYGLSKGHSMVIDRGRAEGAPTRRSSKRGSSPTSSLAAPSATRCTTTRCSPTRGRCSSAS